MQQLKKLICLFSSTCTLPRQLAIAGLQISLFSIPDAVKSSLTLTAAYFNMGTLAMGIKEGAIAFIWVRTFK